MSAEALIETTWHGWFDSRPAWRIGYAKLQVEFSAYQVEAALEEWIAKTDGNFDLAGRPPSPDEVRAMLKREAPTWMIRACPHLAEWGYVDIPRNMRTTGLNDWQSLTPAQRAEVEQSWKAIGHAMQRVSARSADVKYGPRPSRPAD